MSGSERNQPEQNKRTDPLRLEPEAFDHKSTASAEPAEVVIGTKAKANTSDFEESSFDQTSAHKLEGIARFRKGIVISAIFIIGLIISLVYFNSYREFQEEEELARVVEELERTHHHFDDDAIEEARTVQEQVTDSVIGFVTATTVDARYQFSRKHEQLLPRMKKFYRENTLYSSPLSRSGITISEPAIVDGIKFFDVIVKWQGIGSIAVPACETAEGYVVDWEAVEKWQPVDLAQFAAGEIETAENLRVEIAPDDLYLSPYEVSDYISVRISNLAFGRQVYAYIKRGSELEAKFSEQLNTWRSGDLAPFRMILELEFVSTISRSSLVKIVDVKASSWLMPHK